MSEVSYYTKLKDVVTSPSPPTTTLPRHKIAYTVYLIDVKL